MQRRRGRLLAVVEEEAAGFGALVAGIGGLILFIGAVGQGVLMALRQNRYEVDVQRIIDAREER